ncbi:MAG: HAD family phosphatase [Cucumibacter sp.]
MLHSIEAVIFDMDGVLLDTETVYREAAFHAARRLGFEMTDAVHRQTIGVPGDVSDTLFLETYGPDFPLATFYVHWHGYLRDAWAREVPVKPGVVEFLDHLAGRNLPVAVATSSGRKTAENHLSRAGLIARFAAIVTADDVVNGKPHPEPFLTAASRLKIAPAACLALEDSHNGVRAAHAAGMVTIMVPDLLAPIAEIEALCFAVIDDLHGVRAAMAAARERT